MNKTIDINLGGRAFTLDDRAYDVLRAYLPDLRHAMRGQDGLEEVMADIEARLAEIFIERLTDGRNVVTSEDVSAARAMLGEPADFGSETEPSQDAGTPGRGGSGGASGARTSHRRLYRDEEEGIIGGVSAGLAAYLNVEMTWIRVAWVVLVLLGGAGVPFYLLMWIITPSAKTSAERLAMKGESATVENIRRTVERELERANQKIKGFERGAENGLKRFFRWLSRSLRRLFNLAGRLVGVLILIAVALFVVVAVSILIGGGMVGAGGVGMATGLFAPTEILLPTGFGQGSVWMAAALLALLPVTMLVLGVMRLFFKVDFRRTGMRSLMVTGGFSLIAGLILTAVIGMRVGLEFNESSSREQSIDLPTDGGPWTVAMRSDGFSQASAISLIEFDGMWIVEEDSIRIDNLDVEIVRSFDGPARVEWEAVARGATRHSAHIRARNVSYGVHVDRNARRIELDDLLCFPRADRYRAQFIHVRVMLPDSVNCAVEPSAEAFLD